MHCFRKEAAYEILRHKFIKNTLPAVLTLFLLAGCGEANEQSSQDGQGSQMIPDQGPDGNSFKEEYLAFLESCEPMPYCPQAIRDIVVEVSNEFFDGNRKFFLFTIR